MTSGNVTSKAYLLPPLERPEPTPQRHFTEAGSVRFTIGAARQAVLGFVPALTTKPHLVAVVFTVLIAATVGMLI